jgi:hypothetical protein
VEGTGVEGVGMVVGVGLGVGIGVVGTGSVGVGVSTIGSGVGVAVGGGVVSGGAVGDITLSPLLASLVSAAEELSVIFWVTSCGTGVGVFAGVLLVGVGVAALLAACALLFCLWLSGAVEALPDVFMLSPLECVTERTMLEPSE